MILWVEDGAQDSHVLSKQLPFAGYRLNTGLEFAV